MAIADGISSAEQRAWEATPIMVVLTVEEQAKTFYSDGRLDRAQQLFEKLVKMRPKASPYWSMLGVIHRRREQLVPALQCLQQAVDLDSSNRNALVNLGETLVLAGKVEEGADVLRAVFEMGFVEGTPAEDQDVLTKRAGAELAMLREAAQTALDAQ